MKSPSWVESFYSTLELNGGIDMTRCNHRLNRFLIAILVVIGLNFYACSENSTEVTGSDKQGPVAKLEAVANLKATAGNRVSGLVSFVKTDDGVHVTAQLAGLTAGDHGFHIHEKGDCSSEDGKSAGGHFNPHKVNHGGPGAAIHHVGDLGNITADAGGNANYDRVNKLVSFDGTNSIVGKGIIIHAGADDLTSQPTGAAGARVACGVIEQAG